MVSVCVDDNEFEVTSGGVLTRVSHGARLVNDQTVRTVPQNPDDGAGNIDWLIPDWDRTEWEYGDVNGDHVNGRIVINLAGLYQLSVGHGDNGDANTNCNPDNVMIQLALMVNGIQVAADRRERQYCATQFLNASTSYRCVAGDVIRAQFSVLNPPQIAGAVTRVAHPLRPSTKNFLSAVRFGPAS